MSIIKIIATDGLSLGKGYVSSICEDDDFLGEDIFSPKFLVLHTDKTLGEINYLVDEFFSATIMVKDIDEESYVPKFLSIRKWKIDIDNDIDPIKLAESLASPTIVPIDVDVTKFVEDIE